MTTSLIGLQPPECYSVSLIALLTHVTSLGIRGRTPKKGFYLRDRGSFIAQQNDRFDGIQLHEIA